MMEIMNSIKQATIQLHEDVERVAYSGDIMQGRISLRGYNDLLAKNYLVYQDLEPAINDFLLKELPEMYASFSSNRLVDLEKDKQNIDEQWEAPVHQNNDFSMDTVPYSLGVLYVLEGARLGGKVIAKALKRNAALSSKASFDFYEQKDIETPHRWRAFCKYMTEQNYNESDLEAIHTGAKDAFKLFYEVYAKPKIS